MADSKSLTDSARIAEFSEATDGMTGEASKIQRISRQTKGLVEDVRSWVDLKMQLTQLEVEARVEQKIALAATHAAVAAVGAVGVVFLLVAASLALGVWLGNAAWGFLVTGVLLVLVSIGIRYARERVVKLGSERSAQSQ